MKRSSWIAVGTFAVLLAAWLVKDSKRAPSAPAPLSIDGYVGAVSDAELRTQTKDKLPPIKSIKIKAKDSELSLEQLAQDPPASATPDKAEPAKPVEAKWSAKYQRKGHTSQAKATPYRASAMAEVFGRSIRSTFAKEIREADKAEFGLDAAQAIDVEVQWPGREVKLRIGKLDKGSDGAEPTTWVQDPARPLVVFQVTGRDLRSPFEVAWSDLRDRSLLALDLAAIDKLEVHNPADRRAVDFALQRPPLAAGAKREPGEGWSIVAPAGYRVGEVGEWLRSLERLSANEFVDPADVASAKTATGLDDAAAAKVTISAGADKTVLVFGAVDSASEAKDVWLRIEGRDELYKIASYSRDQALARLDQLRQRSLLGDLKAKDASEVQLRGPSVDLQLRRVDGHWRTASGEAAADRAVDGFLGDLDGLQVDYAADVTPGGAGLDAPEWSLRLTMASGAVVTAAFSKESDGHVFGNVQGATGAGDIFKLQSWNVSKIRKSPDDFADKRLFPVAREAIRAVESRPAQGSGFSLALQGETWNLKRDGKIEIIKPETVTEWLSALVALERGAKTAKSAAEAGLDKGFDVVEITTDSGSVLQVAVSAQVSGEDVWVSPLRAGKAVAISAIAQSSAAALKKTAATLLNAAPAEAAPGAAAPAK